MPANLKLILEEICQRLKVDEDFDVWKYFSDRLIQIERHMKTEKRRRRNSKRLENEGLAKGKAEKNAEEKAERRNR